jgi:aminopeptidase N
MSPTKLTLTLGLAAAAWLQASSVAAQEDLLKLAIGDPVRRNAEISVSLDAVVDTRRNETIAPAELYDALGRPRVVLIGEEHTDAAFHDVQLHALKSLHAAAVPLLIGLEMFPASRQAVLDNWVRHGLAETAFVEESDWYTVWGYHWGYYREIFEFARVNQIRLIGLDERGTETDVTISETFSDDHRALVRSFFEVDSPVHGGISDEQFDRLTRAQARRDAVMAQHAADALARNPAHTMVVLAGTGHVLYDLGIARHLPADLREATASIIPVAVDDEPQSVQASVATIVWGVPELDYPRYPELGVVAIGNDDGLAVIHVEEDSPAGAADIRVGDRLTALDQTTLRERSDLSRAIADASWGDIVTVTLERDDATVVVDITLRR